MKNLLLGLIFCPLFLFGQNVENVDISTYKIGLNLETITVLNADSCFNSVLSILKHQGLDFDRIDKENGIITTRARVMKNNDGNSYALKVYFEKYDIQIRVFVTGDVSLTYDQITGTKWYQAQNKNGKDIQSNGFKYMVYWATTIGNAVNGKVVLSEEKG